MIDVGASVATFCILFPIAIGVSYIFFYIKKSILKRKK